MLDALDTRILALIIGVLVFVVAELGFRIARRLPQGSGDASFDLVQAATFTIVGLLLGFSFSLALNRYDARRTAVLNEANDIGTTVLRAELLDPRTASQIRGRLSDYLDARIAFVSAEMNGPDREAAADRSAALSRQMWDLAIDASSDTQSTRLPLFLYSLNDTIDAAGTEAAVTTAHIPDAIILILVFIVLISVGLLGARAGLGGRRAVIPMILLSLVLALVVSMIVDLDRPQRGLIIVSLQPLEALRAQMDSGNDRAVRVAPLHRAKTP